MNCFETKRALRQGRLRYWKNFEVEISKFSAMGVLVMRGDYLGGRPSANCILSISTSMSRGFIR
jgi:hypothetical protein